MSRSLKEASARVAVKEGAALQKTKRELQDKFGVDVADTLLDTRDQIEDETDAQRLIWDVGVTARMGSREIELQIPTRREPMTRDAAEVLAEQWNQQYGPLADAIATNRSISRRPRSGGRLGVMRIRQPSVVPDNPNLPVFRTGRYTPKTQGPLPQGE